MPANDAVTHRSRREYPRPRRFRDDPSINPPSGQTEPMRAGSGSVMFAAFMAGVTVFASACSSEPERSTTRFCELLAVESPYLEGPLSTPGELAALLGRYRDLAARAPLAIEEDWTAVLELVETAAAVDREDPEALADLVDQAYETDLATRRLDEWTRSRCGLGLVVADPVIPTPSEG